MTAKIHVPTQAMRDYSTELKAGRKAIEAYHVIVLGKHKLQISKNRFMERFAVWDGKVIEKAAPPPPPPPVKKHYPRNGQGFHALFPFLGGRLEMVQTRAGAYWTLDGKGTTIQAACEEARKLGWTGKTDPAPYNPKTSNER